MPQSTASAANIANNNGSSSQQDATTASFNGRSNHKDTLQIQRDFFAILSLCLAGVVIFSQMGFHTAVDNTSIPAGSGSGSRLATSEGDCALFFGKYNGEQYYSPESGSVGKPKCLLESKWMKVSQHSVKFPGTDGVIDDWLWVDYHDRINVLVEMETQPGDERQFFVFQQTKYALEGRQSLAIIGGIIEPGESAEAAARREVDEEMDGIQCTDFHFLGRYRTDVNRGVGWLNSFLASGCKKNPKHGKHQFLEDEVGAADTEKQTMKTISLSRIQRATLDGEFIEAQWTATVALALMHPTSRIADQST